MLVANMSTQESLEQTVQGLLDVEGIMGKN